jgi:hypothetical protein
MVYRSMFFAWRSKYERAGLTRDTLYLVRPDTYIGLVDRSSSVETLHRYLDTRGRRIGSAERPGEKSRNCWLKDHFDRLIVTPLIAAIVTCIPRKAIGPGSKCQGQR